MKTALVQKVRTNSVVAVIAVALVIAIVVAVVWEE